MSDMNALVDVLSQLFLQLANLHDKSAMLEPQSDLFHFPL